MSALERSAAPGGAWPADDAPDDGDREVELRLVYTKRKSGRTYVQTVRVPESQVENKLYDLVLVAWGRARVPSDLEFSLAVDEGGSFVGNAEGLILYCAHNMEGARADLAGDYDGGEDGGDL